MRIAIIASGRDLPAIPAEAQQLTNIWSRAGWEVVLIAGEQATHAALAAAASPPIDRFWISAHMCEDGIGLADGELSIPELAQWIGMSQAAEGVLNGCSSAVHVAQIQRFADVDLAAAIRDDLPDDTAAITAAHLARAWVEAGSLQEAARRATANGAIEYRFYPAPRRPRTNRSMQPDPAQINTDELAANVEKLIDTIQGDPRWGQPGLLPTMETLRSEFKDFRREDAEYRRQDAAWKAMIEQEIIALKRQRTIITPKAVLVALVASVAITAALVILLRTGF